MRESCFLFFIKGSAQKFRGKRKTQLKRFFGDYFFISAVHIFIFVEFLKKRGFTIIPIKLEDELHYANNFLTIAPRHIMAVGNQSEQLQKAFAQHGVKVEWIPLETLIKGYGAAHCMTQVIKAELTK